MRDLAWRLSLQHPVELTDMHLLPTLLPDLGLQFRLQQGLQIVDVHIRQSVLSDVSDRERYSSRADCPTTVRMRTIASWPSASVRRRSSLKAKLTGCGLPWLIEMLDAYK